MKNEMSNDIELFPPSVPEAPAGVDRRAFMMRSAAIGAAAVMTGCTAEEKAKQVGGAAPPPAGASNDSPDLEVVKKAKGPVMTTLDEFYKVGPGPSSSHTIGPMRITYDFYQRCTRLPPDQLAKATDLKVFLFGSLSATGKGHGTERAALAGIIGKEPATVEPEFLDVTGNRAGHQPNGKCFSSRLRLLGDRATHLNTVHAGHVDIDERGIDPALSITRESGFAAIRYYDRVTEPGKNMFQRLTH